MELDFIDKPKKGLKKIRASGTLLFTVEDELGQLFSSPNFHECFDQMKKTPGSHIGHAWNQNAPKT